MKTVLIYGDSNTWGFTPGTMKRYPYDVRWTSVAEARLGSEYKIIADGINGRTTVYEDPCAECRLAKDSIGYALLANSPIDLVVLALGTNDLKFTTADASAKGIEKLIRIMLGADVALDGFIPIFADGVKILVVSPIHVHERVAEILPGSNFANAHGESLLFAEKFKFMADAYGTHFLDASLYARPSDTDGVHMDPESHASLGAAVADKIKEILG